MLSFRGGVNLKDLGSYTTVLGADVKPPSVVLSFTAAEPVGAAFEVTATFSEKVYGFVVGDITVTNGTAGSFAGSGKTYTFDVTPDWTGNITVQVPAGVCIDGAGNLNLVSNLLAVTVDYDHTVLLPGVIDTYVDSIAPNNNYAADTTFRVRASTRCPIIKWNLATIPSGVDVQDATLTLTTSVAIGANITAQGVKVANSAWSATATWNYAVDGVTRWAGDAAGDGGADAGCSVSGTDYLAAVLGTGVAPATANTAFDVTLTPSVVESWLLERDGSGYATIRMIQAAATNQDIHSLDSVTPGYRPILEVHYHGAPPLP